MDDYLTKPVKMEDLRIALDRWQPARRAQLVARPENAPAGTAHSGVLDESVLEGLRALQDRSAPDLLKNLIGLFLDDTPARIEAVRGAVEQKQAVSLARLAHALKGASANLGVRSMTQTCGQLEELGRTDKIREAPVLVTRLEAEFDQVRVLFRNIGESTG
jgi:HPt (histidine-containing phosphotransfer) domain-containing protein